MDAARLLRDARESAGMSQADLARAAGVSRGLVCRYERGHVDPTTRQLERLLQPLGLELVAAVRAERSEMSSRLEALLDDHADLPDRNDDDWGVHDETGARLSEDEYRARKHANRERYQHWVASQSS